MLCAAIYLTPPQIYNAYEGKENLFRRAIERYLDRESDFCCECSCRRLAQPPSSGCRESCLSDPQSPCPAGKFQL